MKKEIHNKNTITTNHASLTATPRIALIGLGYVGLPLARLFATKYSVVGFDINEDRIAELMSGTDSTLEVDDATLQSVLVTETTSENGLFCTNKLEESKIVLIISLPYQHLLIKTTGLF